MSILDNKKFLQVSNIITYILTIFVNFLANQLPLGGRTTGEVSDTYPDLFAPAGTTFIIWFFIYLFLGMFMFYTGYDLFKTQAEELPYIEQVSFYYILSNILNIAWLFSWHYNIIPLSFILMIGILLSLIKIYLGLNIGLEEISTKDKILVHVPFSIYLGWIFIATIANTTVLFKAIGWDGFGISEPIWTIIVIIVALILTLLIQYTREDIVFSFVVIWASIGIVIKRLNPYTLNTLLMNLSVLFEPIYFEIIITAVVGLIIVSIGVFIILIQKLK